MYYSNTVLEVGMHLFEFITITKQLNSTVYVDRRVLFMMPFNFMKVKFWKVNIFNTLFWSIHFKSLRLRAKKIYYESNSKKCVRYFSYIIPSLKLIWKLITCVLKSRFFRSNVPNWNFVGWLKLSFSCLLKCVVQENSMFAKLTKKLVVVKI